MTKKLSLLLLICFLSALNINAEVYRGSCGTNVGYSLDTSTGVLKIAGTGAIDHYSASSYHYAPWYDKRDYIKSIEIDNGITKIGTQAFIGCSQLISVTIPNSVTYINGNAFDGCSKLRVVCCFAQNVPSGYYGPIFNSSDVSNTTLYVKKGSLSVYKKNEKWNNFGSINEEGTLIDGIYYNLDDSTKFATVAIGSTKYAGSVVIPSSIIFNNTEYIVASIDNFAFLNCSDLKFVIIPNSVKYIGDYAFQNCSNLASLIVGTGVRTFGENVFYGNQPKKVIWLTNTPPQNYTSATGIVNYVANNNYTSLRKKTVYPFLSSMFVVDGIRYVPVSPSERTCDAIDCVYNETAEKINIGEKVTNKGISLKILKIQPYLCYGNTYIKNVNIESSYKGDILSESFYGCTGITSAIISNQGNIGVKTFYGCATKDSSTFVINNTGNISSSAFEGCTSITSATISNLGHIDSIAFKGCTGIKTATISNQGDIGEKTFYGCATKNPATFIINNKGSISKSAFEGCTGITSATISNQRDIGERAFYGCAKKDSATFIINNKGSISKSAFEGCTGITSATINNQGDIGEKAFYGCATKNPATFVIKNKGVISKSAFEGCTKMTAAELGDEIPSIGERAFYGCSNLSDIIIPDTVTSIGSYAFYNCSNLSLAKIGSGIKAIPIYTFSGCSSLKDVQIGKNVTSIGDYAFNGCSTLPKIHIPQSVTSIANYVFSDCSELKTVIMDNDDSDLSLSSNGSSPLFANCPLDSVYIGRNITYNTSSSSGYSPFYRNTSLRTVVITDKETEISDNEFYGCTNLQSFKVGDGVTSFGKYAFSGCSSLKNLSFGTKLQSIGQEAFSDCTDITAIVSKVTTPPTCGTQALDDINKWDCVLYVPEGYVETYQAADQWKEFFFMEEGDPFAVLRGDANGDGKVDMDDATFVTNIILGIEDATEAADVNNDGKVNMPDVMFIMNYIKNAKFPDEE